MSRSDARFAGTTTPTVADAESVKRANRRLYDAVADRYETLDGRRDDALTAWVRDRLEQIAAAHGRGVLLDLGSGSGVITRAADGLFERTIALDLSPRILATAGPIADHRVAADTDALPLADGSVDVVTCFAVLHHLYDADRLTAEVARVLKPGGVFWSDHDMDEAFYQRFRWLLGAYRRLRSAGKKYTDASGELDDDTYHLAEFRENGVGTARILRQFQAVGLHAEAKFHWFGLTPTTNALFGQRYRPRGWAPLSTIFARRPVNGLPSTPDSQPQPAKAVIA